MLPISTKELVRYTPPKRDAADEPPTYLLAVPTVAARAAFRRRMTEHGANNPSDEALRQKLIEGIDAVAAADQRAELTAIVREAAERPEDAALQARADDVERQVLPFHPPYAALLADRAYYLELLPLVCCQLFLKGVEGADPLPARGGVLTDEALAAVPADHLRAVGLFAFGLMFLPRGLEKNSASPSPSPSTPATSAAAGRPPTPPSGGGSSGRSTKKTLASS